MLQDETAARTEAIAWFLRLRDDAHPDWAGFTAWLEASPGNNAAYEAAAAADADFGSWIDQSAPPAFSNDNAPIRRVPRYRAAGWTVAAAIVAGLGYQALMPAAATYAVETAAGEHRAVVLSDGTRIDLNGGTHISLRQGDPRFASLDHGEATFTVVHHADNPFTLAIGDDRLQDVGTVFNVVRTPSGTEAQVAEGSVLYNPGAEAVRVGAGKMLRISADGGTATMGTVRPETVAVWRQSKLVYDHAPLSRIADDLSRNLGVPISVAPDIADHPFSGVIRIGDGRPAFFEKLGLLLDVTAIHQDRGWRLASRTSASR